MRAAVLTLILFSFMACPAQTDSIVKRKPFVKRVVNSLYQFVKEFSRADTNFVEPQHYNYTLMLQNTNTYEVYRVTTSDGDVIKLAPRPSVKLGPYVGWRWVFLGYTVSLNHIGNDKTKKEFDLSLYSSQIGIDLFYRKTGNDYRIRRMHIGDGVDTEAMRDVAYDGLNASIEGFNLYYIFNHRKFSYPAAFSQSTVQRRSCGSPMVGLGYTRHSLSINWAKLYDITAERLGADIAEQYMDADLESGRIRYTDVAFSGGYGYNWVFARNWLFASSLSLALGYKHTSSESDNNNLSFKDFSIRNFNIDGVGRFGIVWNNTKWYFGSSVILHSYNYSKKEFSTNNFFGSLNIYIGFNFDRR